MMTLNGSAGVSIGVSESESSTDESFPVVWKATVEVSRLTLGRDD